MSLRLEAFLAKIYVDAGARNRFLQNPREEAIAAGLAPADVDAVAKIDRRGLQMTADSLAHKRKGKSGQR